jgi:thiol-disulfide isomerase/thioredoxin
MLSVAAGLLAAAGAATAVAAVAGTSQKPDWDLHLRASDADPASPTTSTNAPTAGATTPTTVNPLVRKDPLPTSMPDKQFELLKGGLGSLRDHAGEPMVVNFWYSTCAPCRQEMPAIESVHEALGDKVAFVGLAVRDDAASARDFVQETGVTYEIGLDPSGVLAESFGLFSFPTTFLVDGEGHIVTQHTGGVTAAQLRKLIDDNLH